MNSAESREDRGARRQAARKQHMAWSIWPSNWRSQRRCVMRQGRGKEQQAGQCARKGQKKMGTCGSCVKHTTGHCARKLWVIISLAEKAERSLSQLEAQRGHMLYCRSVSHVLAGRCRKGAIGLRSGSTSCTSWKRREPASASDGASLQCWWLAASDEFRLGQKMSHVACILRQVCCQRCDSTV